MYLCNLVDVACGCCPFDALHNCEMDSKEAMIDELQSIQEYAKDALDKLLKP